MAQRKLPTSSAITESGCAVTARSSDCAIDPINDELCSQLSTGFLRAWAMALSASDFEWFIERASIIEYDGRRSRADAEQLAYLECVQYIADRGLPV